MKKNALWYGILMIVCAFSAFAQENQTITTEEKNVCLKALDGYISNDSERRTLELDAQNASLALQKLNIEQGNAFSFSTGQTSLTLSPEGNKVTSSPSVSVAVPRLKNSSLAVTVPFTTDGNGNAAQGIDLTVKTGIVSGLHSSRKHALAEKNRALFLAEQSLTQRNREAEKEFWEKLKKQYTNENSILEAQNALVLAQQEFNKMNAEGYEKSTTRYRSAELKVRTKERERSEAARKLESSLAIFSTECGMQLNAVPRDIPDVILLSITEFNAHSFSEFEKAQWIFNTNTLARKATASPFTLDGTAGYSWKQECSTSNGVETKKETPSVSAGVGITAFGATMATAVSIPIEDTDSPTVTLSLEWKPSSFKTGKIDKKMNSITAQKEQLDIVKAEKKCSETIAEKERRKADLDWQKKVYEEEYDVFSAQDKEQQAWYRQGLLNETDYNQALTDSNLAQSRVLTARIDRLLYNLEIQGLFVNTVVLEEKQ